MVGGMAIESGRSVSNRLLVSCDLGGSEPLEARGAAPPPTLQPRQGECLSLHPTQGVACWNEGALRIGFPTVVSRLARFPSLG
jgi:hypothetical protein